MKRFFAIIAIFTFFVIFLSFAGTAVASPAEDVILELERSTSFHWGQDCLAWIVRYSADVVEPWVESEAQRAKFNEAQKQEYRRAFIAELRLNETEPILVSIYAFGASPLDLKPFEDKIAIINSSGERIRPTSYERIFDEPIQGMVQGLVFFPKQRNTEYAVSLRGLGVFAERAFHFSDTTVAEIPQENTSPVRDDLVVIDMPQRPTPPPPVQKPAPAPIVIEEKPKPTQTPPEPAPKPETPAPSQGESANVYVSRERTLQTFINSWIANDVSAMYGMLSEESKKLYTRETFDKEVKKLADIRRGMISSYKIDWIGEERAKISTTKKLLIMRTLISKTLGVVRAGNEWRISW